jgi:hypothetical protein
LPQKDVPEPSEVARPVSATQTGAQDSVENNAKWSKTSEVAKDQTYKNDCL